MTIAELREKVQTPRKEADTWYGRNVMRRLSVYITYALDRLGWTPNQATLLSIVPVIFGFWALCRASWGWGIVWINLWYLLDHVDGELARLKGKSSPTGFLFDSFVNFLAQPLFFFGLGWGLSATLGKGMVFLGFLGALGYLMITLIPMCEVVVVYEFLKKKGRLS